MEPITKYPNIDKLLVELTSVMKQTLKAKLLGVYLSGSLVLGDFDSRVSDIDLLAVVDEDITNDELVGLESMHQAFIGRHPDWEDRIETAYMSLGALSRYRTEDCRVVNISPGEPMHFTMSSSYWLMDIYTVQERGKTLFGLSPDHYIPRITRDDLVQTVRDYFKRWPEQVRQAITRGEQAYVVLTLARNLYAQVNGEQISKPGGAAWARDRYPQWAGLLERALQWRQEARHDSTEDSQSHKEVIRFTDFAVSQSQAL
jgi:predicted nucleotidyltransferase